MVLRSIGISGEAVADGKVLAFHGRGKVPLKVWRGVGSGVGSPGLLSMLCSECLYREVVGSFSASLHVGLWGSFGSLGTRAGCWLLTIAVWCLSITRILSDTCVTG